MSLKKWHSNSMHGGSNIWSIGEQMGDEFYNSVDIRTCWSLEWRDIMGKMGRNVGFGDREQFKILI